MHVVCPHVQSSQNTLAGEKFKRKARSESLARLCNFVFDHQEVKFIQMKLDPLHTSQYVVIVLQAFRKIAKSDYYLRLIRLSVRMEQLVCHWTDFHEILYLFFEILSIKFKFH
jgi:hypothetical protein